MIESSESPESSESSKSPESAESMRLQNVLAQAGIASRRGSGEIIAAGEVTVNGKVVIEPGSRVNPATDEILYKGKPLTAESKVYFMFNKPFDVVTTLKDTEGRRTVQHFFRRVPARVFPVGRLDRNTTGLLILTNDGR